MTLYKPSLNIKFFDTLSNQLQDFKTLTENQVKIYVCGPTVYDRPHLGNARSIVVYDLFYRFFLQIFEKVIYVRNITDVDDKINNSAKEQNISIQELTTKIIDYFYHDINALNVLKPTFEPKVTENIAEIIELIKKILANNHGYISDNHVLFDVSSYHGYGKLSNRKIDELISGSRIEIADYKKTPLDFVLWKPADDQDDPSSVFDSPWGKGRPGWHIECSAMSHRYLGENFDFHGGGADLQFPHHENEIAQSCSAHDGSNYASFWVHNGFLTVDGEKMSKSLKNFVTVNDLLAKGVNGTTIRLMLLSTHYRKPLDFNQKILDDSQKILQKFHEIIDISDINNTDFSTTKISTVILEYLADDLNISKVLAILHEQHKSIKNNKTSQKLEEYIANLNFLGFLDKNFIEINLPEPDLSSGSINFDQQFIEQQLKIRQELKAKKLFQEADKIRDNLLQMGIVIEDKPNNQSAFYLLKKN